MSEYSDRALSRASNLLSDLYDAVRVSFPNYIVHELEDSVTVARAYLTGTATVQDYDMLRGWTGEDNPIVWATFCNERNDMNHVYRTARMTQGNMYRQLQIDLSTATDIETNTHMITWCDLVAVAVNSLPVGAGAIAEALHEIARLRQIYGAQD